MNFVSHIYTFSLAGNIIFCTPSQSTNREKQFILINHKGKAPTLAGKKHFSIHLFPHKPRYFHASMENVGA